MNAKPQDMKLTLLLSALPILLVSFHCHGSKSGGYTEEQVYSARPAANREMAFGHVGVTGVMVRVHREVTIKVEKTVPGSPADGKFRKGEIITGINGISLKGRNPFVTLGKALTSAEATDGRMIFDVTSADGKRERKETVRIPVMGAYSKTWPLNCSKSRRIIRQAAEFFADRTRFGARYEQRGIPAALACLFLLSTGEDRYLPPVKAYFDGFPKDVSRIGDHTWNNGYNGIACGEYYLRTGDKSVLPMMQYYCDDAKRRQKFGCGWVHWGTGISPGYVASGLMNPAGAQVLTTLLLGKECGVQVDDGTLLGALRFFYRFAGRGTVPYGDHRGEGGLGSNGKDGMIAAAMQIAAGAQGDAGIYEKARQYLGMSMLTSYPVLVKGHGDEGRGDGIWRSIITSYMLRDRPGQYRKAMDRLTWWHDLSREPGGSIGIAMLTWENGIVGSSGPGVALSYTAPLKTLRITGAPRTRHSRDYTLPANIWGTEADQKFLSIDHNPKYYNYGGEEPTHIPFWALGGAYHRPKTDLKNVPLDVMRKNVYHRRYMIRVQAAKALRTVGALDQIEKLLSDPDPRVRRAGLDGLTDYNYWFAMGRNPIAAGQFSPTMVKAIRKMLSDPDESWWVVDGALLALKLAPAKDIQSCQPLIMAWTRHSDWWLRESAFMALSGLEKDDQAYLAVLPTLLTMLTDEYHTQPRSRMLAHLKSVLKRGKRTSPAGQLILSGLKDAVKTSEIKAGIRSPEGAHNVFEVAKACLQDDPDTAVMVARMIQARFNMFSTGNLIQLVGTPNSNRDGRPFGLYTTLAQLSPQQGEALKDILFDVYRQELINRMTAEKAGRHQPLVDTIIDLTRLREPIAGWQPVGTPKPEGRIWRYRSFDPQIEKDKVHPREKKRFRTIQLPAELAGWHEAAYDDSQWEKGCAPIGVGVHKAGRVSFKNNADWGKGEFIVMRTTFELDALDCDSYRLSILAKQGFHVYLNGHRISTYIWWKDKPHYRPIVLDARHIRYLKKGTNVLAAYGNVEYDKKSHAPAGQMDLFIEGLKMSDLKPKPKPLKVYILAGQSNMEGHARVETFDYLGGDPKTASLLEEMRGPDGKPRTCDNVWISYFTGWKTFGEGYGKLTAGYGARGNPAENGGKIGPEYTFGITMDKAYDGPILLIKTAWGGKSLNTDFRPPSAGPYRLNDFQKKLYFGPKGHGIPADMEKWKAEKAKATGKYYRLMMDHVKKVLADPKRVCPAYDPEQGYEMAGFVWFQGWNDMCDGHTYPDSHKPGAYALYTELMAHFIRDVRKDLKAPGMPFVIGVIGVDGDRAKGGIANLRPAMAAPAGMPEFAGTVAAVETAPFWDHEMAALQSKKGLADHRLSVAHLITHEGVMEKPEAGVPGWEPIGGPKPQDRIWRFTAFDPQNEEDRLPKKEKKRFRDVTLPEGLKGWHRPDFDDSRWKSGKAPIGKGVWKHRLIGDGEVQYVSDWGDGEFILMRTTFEVDNLDYEAFRISVLARQGFHIYLNGHRIDTYIWWKDEPQYRPVMLEVAQCRHLRKGVNVLAAYANIEYDRRTQAPHAAIDFWIEGITKAGQAYVNSRAYLDRQMQKVCTPREQKIIMGCSNGGYHYLGSAKIMAQIGRAFAEAMIRMEKQ